MKGVVKDIGKLLQRYRVDGGRKFALKDFDPADTGPFKPKDKDRVKDALAKGVEDLAEAQEKLYAQNRWGVLLVFQAMDAAGKDGTIKAVMSGVNPQGCEVHAFKAPSEEELDHDFLWRCTKRMPERGRIGIFNRSYYEEVLVVRVHEELLAKQHLPPACTGRKIWKERCEDIAGMERYLARNGYVVLKFYLNVSKDEQKARFLSRLDEPAKNWKFSVGDVKERGHWDDYMAAYDDAIARTAAPHAPWYVVPADNKWYARFVVLAAIHDALGKLELAFPTVDAAKRGELEQARKLLTDE
jgi:PPK2 family polyphosphate:nucleotide phosphotransferase